MAEGMYTYQLEPKEDERFYPSRAKAILEETLNEKLKGTTFNSGKSAEITEELAQLIRSKVKELKIPRYKLGVQVFYGEMKGQGLRVASKCLWDPNFDNWASYTFTNESIHCTAIVFGVYME